MNRQHVLAAVALVLVQILWPAAAQAQTSARSPTAGAAASSLPALSLHMADWGEEARRAEWHARSVDAFRLERARALVRAGLLHTYAGRTGRAARVLEEAARSALSVGDVVTAADAYVKAAFVAYAAGRGDEVLAYGKRALALANSPHLTPEEAATIRAFFNRGYLAVEAREDER